MSEGDIRAARAALEDHAPGASLELRLKQAAEAAGGETAALLGTLEVELARARHADRFALARAQLERERARALAGPPPERPGRNVRLSGTSRALGLMLAEVMRGGALPGLRPRAWDEAAYLSENPDVAALPRPNGLKHWLRSGASEGRPPPGLVTRYPECFDDMAGAPPATLEALAEDATPRYVADCPGGLRHHALDAVRAAAPQVSVIIPTWNRAHVVGEAVVSALLQSFPAREVIVVDDGSEDGTEALLRARFDGPLTEGRLRILSTDHAGVAAARNAGLDAAAGDIVAYLDSDNLWEQDHLLFLAALLVTHPEAPAAYAAIGRHNLDDGWSDILFGRWDRARIAQENYVDLNAFAHRREAGLAIGGSDTGLRRLVDWDLILRLTDGAAPVCHPLVTAHHVLSGAALGNITLTEDADAARARIAAKGAGRSG